MANFFKVSSKNRTLGQHLTLTIERLDLNGCGVARYQKKPVFIENTLPGEKVSIKIIEHKNKYFRGKLLTVEQKSAKRITPQCQHYQLCGGCDLQHLALSEQQDFKQQKVTNLFQRNDIAADLPWQKMITSMPWHYRRKTRIGVQYDKVGQVTLGFRQKSTNQLTTIKSCPVLVEPITAVFKPLISLLNQLTLTRSVGHIEMVVTDKVTIVVRQLKKQNLADKTLWLEYAQKYHWQVVSYDGEVYSPLTAISGLHFMLPEMVKLAFEVSDFIQINQQVNHQMIEQAMQWLSLSAQDVVLDLFCGLGNFSLPIARQVQKVVGIEGVQSMVDRATVNAKSNAIDNCQFFQADLNSSWLSQTWAKQTFDKVVLDPARAGAFEAIEQLIPFKINKILYISCDPATLARDSKYLLSHGYKIVKVAIVDMFCQTKHVETMVLFSLK